MKRLLLIMLMLASIIDGYSQDTTAVVTLGNNQTADQLYKKAKEWFALSFKSAKDVIQLTDNDTKTIIAKGVISKVLTPESSQYPAIYSFTLSVQFKDGRYRYELTNTRVRFEVLKDEVLMSDYKVNSENLVKNIYAGLPKRYQNKAPSPEVTKKNIDDAYNLLSVIPKSLINELTDYLNKDKKENW